MWPHKIGQCVHGRVRAGILFQSFHIVKEDSDLLYSRYALKSVGTGICLIRTFIELVSHLFQQ